MTYYRSLKETDLSEVYSLQFKDFVVEEARTSLGRDTTEAMTASLQSSKHKWVLLHDDKICAVFGINEITPEVGVFWAVTTDLIDTFKKTFIRMCKQAVEEAQKLYPTLINVVPADNAMVINWVKYLGFTVDDDKFILADENSYYCRIYRKAVG